MGMYDRDWYRNPPRGGWWNDLHPVGKIMLVLFVGALASLFVMQRMEMGRRAAAYHDRYEEMMREQFAQAASQAPGGVHDAAERGDVRRLAELLTADPSQVSAVLHPDAPDQPLHRAAWNDQRPAADLLLRFGADVNARGNRGMTPLHCAALQGSSDVAELLIKRGADLEARDDNGNTPANLAQDPGIRTLLRSHSARR